MSDYRYPDWYMRVYWWGGWSFLFRIALLVMSFLAGWWISK
ncbi:hypothetical protein HWB90_gp071 [Mycobacterium phage Fowlmouth]|uniref:Uncharacterized protein n=1 Tax=Mycobacterium phage Fowlmouth TaxID=2419978 RepID=A0A3G2KGH6_9CAUD|nr:hypothetical protein HWB90_gp071 [Mycobacterium phage Fowlmouth]AYN58068.1 hypothetical protein SEA_FOWLMOUTH_119 [Mycobacterium phage Fowlmouth]